MSKKRVPAAWDTLSKEASDAEAGNEEAQHDIASAYFSGPQDKTHGEPTREQLDEGSRASKRYNKAVDALIEYSKRKP